MDNADNDTVLLQELVFVHAIQSFITQILSFEWTAKTPKHYQDSIKQIYML